MKTEIEKRAKEIGDAPIVKEGMASMPWSEFETLTRKAAMWDAHEAHQNELAKAHAEFWAKIASIKEMFHTKNPNP
jgi:flagellar biosynthesis regulator FlaF